MSRWLAALFLMISAVPAAAETRLTEEAIGPFRLTREDYRNTGTPIMHVRDSWTTVRLVWRSADGLAEIELEDDGFALRSSITAYRSASQAACAQIGALHQYGDGPPTGAFWHSYGPELATFLRKCAGVDGAATDRYVAEHAAAAASFPAALQRMKDVAADAFQGIARRCLQLEQSFGPSSYGPQCARWSAPVNRPQ